MIKIKSTKVTNKTIYGLVEFQVRGELLTYSYQANTSARYDDDYQLESGDDSILTNDEVDIIDELITEIMNEYT